MTGLLTKRGAGLDLKQFGPASIVRSSLINFDIQHQGFYVEFLCGEVAGQVLDREKFNTYGVPPLHKTVTEQGTMIYAEYEDAVACEVHAIQAMRVAHGKDFA